MEKWINLTRTYENRTVLVNTNNIAYVEENPDGTSTVGFNYGGGFSVKEGILRIADDIMANVRIP